MKPARVELDTPAANEPWPYRSRGDWSEILAAITTAGGNRWRMVRARQGDGRFVPGVSASPETQIRPGERISPETEIRPGQRLSPATEFVPGQAAHNRLPVGSVTVRIYKGTRRAWVKVAEPKEWRLRALVVYEQAFGPVPRGLVVHHRDHDSLNDVPENLVAITRAEHAQEHRDELNEAKARAAAMEST
jgi:hypothetical protein